MNKKANLAQHHLNTLYPAVWDRGYTLYPSPVAKQAGGKRRDPLFALPFLPFQDALQGLTHQAHRQHLRLIPWFEYGLIIPASSPIATTHPDWLTTNQAGGQVANKSKPSKQQGIEVWLSFVGKRPSGFSKAVQVIPFKPSFNPCSRCNNLRPMLFV